jgi:hypothetical protein
MATWMDLPFEIRRDILEMVLQDSDRSGTTAKKKKKKKAPYFYAVVCREWQEVFEKESFKRLVLTRSDLQAFKKIARSRRGFVKHIWLRIQLAKYHCPSCGLLESGLCIADNNARIATAIHHLFDILSRWSKDSDWGVALEISAYSPSDTKHAFNDRYYRAAISEIYSKPIDEYQISRYNDCLGYTYADKSWVWSNSWRPNTWKPNPKSILRLFGYSCNPVFTRPLPKVDAVTSFLVRRQSRHRIGAKLLGQVLDCFPKLEYMNFELWREFSRVGQRATDMGIFSLT